MPDEIPRFDDWVKTQGPSGRVRGIASKIGLAPDLVDDYLKVTKVESGHNVNVRDSHKGAKGFGQVMPDRPGQTVRTISGRRYNLRDPDENIEAGLRLFAAGGNDPVGRRLEYFGGAKARQRYERTGRIPNISDGNMTAEQYVRATGGQKQQKQEIPRFDDWVKQQTSQSPTGQAPPTQPNETQTPTNPPVSPKKSKPQSVPTYSFSGRAFGAPVSTEQQAAIRAGVRDFNQRRRQPAAPEVIDAGNSVEVDLATGRPKTPTRTQRVLDALGKPSSSYDPRNALRYLLTDNSTPEERQAEEQRQQRVAQTSTGEYLSQIPKSAALGLSSAAESGLKSIAVLAKKLDFGNEYEGKQASDLATYRAGEWIARNARQLLQSNPDLEQEFIVGKSPQAIGQAMSFLLGGVATKAPRLAVAVLGAGMTTADAYDEVRRRGGSDEEAVNAGLLAGAILGPTELIGTRRLMKALSGTGVEQRLNSALVQALRDGSRDAVENALQEIGQEYAQGKITGVSREGRQLLEAGLLGAIGGAGVTGPVSLIAGRRSGRAQATAIPEVERIKRGAEGRVLREEAQGVQREPALEQYLDAERSTDERVNAPSMRPTRAAGETLDEPQAKVQPQVEAQRETVESTMPTAEAVPARSAVDRGNAADISTRGSEPARTGAPAADESPQRFYHRDYGELSATKVVNREGKPKTVYHGSGELFEAFDPAKQAEGLSRSGQGFFFADSRRSALGYAVAGRSGYLYEAQLDIRNPAPFRAYRDAVRANKGNLQAAVKDLQAKGYDGYYDSLDKAWVPFSVDQIRVQRRVRVEKDYETGKIIETPVDVDTPSQVARFYHRDYGEVVESPNQRRVGKGRVRVVAEDGSEHVIKRADMTGRGNQRAIPIRETAPEPEPSVTEPVKESRADLSPREITSVKNAVTDELRRDLSLLELEGPQRKSFQQSIDNALARGLHQQAEQIADDVISGKKSDGLTDEEAAGIQHRIRELENEWQKIYDANPADPALKPIEARLDNLTRATREGGTPIARALSFRRSTIDKEFNLVTAIRELRDLKGAELTAKERSRLESLDAENRELRAKLTEREANSTIQSEIDRTRRQRRKESKDTIDAEWADLQREFAELRSNRSVGAFFKSEEGALDPDAVKLIGRMARNRIRAGVNSAQDLVREVYDAVTHLGATTTEREVRDAISGYSLTPKSSRSEIERRIAQLRSELQSLSKSEDIAAGIRSPRQEGPQGEFRKDQRRQRQLESEITDLERRMSESDFSDKPRREPPRYTAETARIQRRLNEIRVEYERMKYKATRSTGGQITDELIKAANIPKTIKSIGDISAVFRQGGYYSLTHPVSGFARPLRAMLQSFSETGFANVEHAIRTSPNFELAKKSGVEFTGVDRDSPHLNHLEEGYLASQHLDYVPGLKQVKDFSERTFVSFLDAQRIEQFNRFYDALTPSQRNDPKELQAIAKLINSATGRGNLGKRGNQAAPFLNIALFSPRLVVSRAQLLNKMFNPVAIARMPAGARKQMITDNVKFLAATAAFLGLAKALGATISLDPDDAEFLKIRIGNSTYDTLTGLQQPLRYIINMSRATTQGDTYPGRSMKELTSPFERGSFTRSKLSPLAGSVVNFTTGSDFEGRRFSWAREGRELITPLPVKDFYEAMKQEGIILGAVKAAPALTGIGVQSYPPSLDKPRTHAEKLSRKLIREKMPDDAREDEQIDADRKKADLRARSRRGDDVSGELDQLRGKLTERQIKSILNARNKTRLQEDFNRLSADDALLVWQVATSTQRDELREIMERKAALIDLRPPDEQPALRQKFTEAGIPLSNRRLSRPGRASRPSRGSR